MVILPEPGPRGVSGNGPIPKSDTGLLSSKP